MDKEIIEPCIKGESEYCGYEGILIEGTKHSSPRGYCYNLVVILPNNDLVFGGESGNYAGGVTLSPNDEHYCVEKEKKLNYIKTDDLKFYKLIVENIK